MCQLTFINLRSKQLNRYMTWALLNANTATTHRDGCGVFHKNGGLVKSQQYPAQWVRLGTEINRIVVDASPVMAHVRQATLTRGYRIVSDATAHPFEKENIVLAHNGSLSFVDTKEEDDPRFAGKIDSESFAIILDDLITSFPEKSFLECLQLAYNHFNGKFAFLIYNKKEGAHYIARGETAKLYKSFIITRDKEDQPKTVGYVINTDDLTLGPGAYTFSSGMQSLFGVYYGFTQPALLEENTLFKFKEGSFELDVVGKITETHKAVTTSVNTYTYEDFDYGYHNRGGVIKPATQPIKKPVPPIVELQAKIVEFMEEWELGIDSIDELFLLLLGNSILEVAETDLKTFVDRIIPELEKEAKKQPNITREWRKVKNAAYMSEMDVYALYNLHFPYFFNKVERLREIRREQKQDEHIDR